MTKAAQLLKGLAALVLLAGLVAGVPWALWHFVGWPLPHHVPSAAQVTRTLNHQGIPAQTLIDALAVVVWLTWATLIASLLVEIPAALSGRHAPRLPIAGTFQPLTGRLVAAVIVAGLTLAPRPAHPATPGSPRPPSLTTRRPVAALVVSDATLTASVTPAPPQSTTPPPAVAAGVSSTAPTPQASSTQPTAYVVQRGDTLWGIAQRELGDPLRWSEVYQLNEGRPQPGGVTLTDPHWIDPGWTLLLPVPASTTPPPTPTPPAPAATPAPSTAPAPAPTLPSTTAPSAATPSRTSSPSTAPTDTQSADTAGSTAGHSPGSTTSGRPAAHDAQPVRLPSGSVVAASFATGVAATIALGRLRRRHAYRYRPPEPGRARTVDPLRPTVSHLRRAAVEDQPPPADGGPFPSIPVEEEERRQDPGRLDIGTRRGDLVTVELTDLCGVALDGPAADDIARALIAALMVRAGPGAAEVIFADDTAARLLPGLPPNRSIRRAATPDLVARAVESERVARRRRFAAVDAADAKQFRTENPENPLPLLLVLADGLPAESLGRWGALLADASALDIAIVFLAPTPIATGILRVDTGRRVTAAEPADRLGRFVGAELFGLRADETTEVLAAVIETAADGDIDDQDAAISQVLDGLAEEPWPEIEPDQAASDQAAPPDRSAPSDRATEPDATTNGGSHTERPITVRLFGHLEIAVRGQPVATGMRSRARDLLAWYLLRPEGATSDEAVDALWPDTPPGRVHGQFWRSFSDLRTRLREVGGEDLEVFTKAGEHYQPNATEIACDLWEFQAALRAASRTDDPLQARAALRRAVDAYRGDLMAGADHPWVEPVRQDLHRRALDAHLRLAELEDQAGRPDAAVEVLERAIEADRYAEEPYRRLMRHHAAHDRLDAVVDVWRLLQGRLADLDLDVEAATASLYRQLTAPQPAIREQLRSR